MTAFSISVAVLFLFVLLVAALPFAYAVWRRISGREPQLQIWRVMARRGIVTDGAPAAQAKLARAVRRCVLCPSIEQCDHWLASDGQTNLAEFCPNATLLEQLEQR